ncbi:MAG: ornithine carbamoyltransferase [Dorea sp.]|mgnify:FL=1
MKPVIDLSKEYGLALEGGGARGAYQIGAWKALKEAGVKINAVAGTSVGALNGALICMGDLGQAERIWSEMTYSAVMEVDDSLMERFMDNKLPFKELFHEFLKIIGEGGVDVTPLRRLIHEYIDEKKIRESGIAFNLLTFSLTDKKELDLSLEDIPEGLLEDYLLASAYLLGFKNEELHGKRYMDGGMFNNLPVGSLVDGGCENIIAIRIYGPGREPKVKLPQGAVRYEIAPRVKLGNILDFNARRSRQNMKIGYYDAMRMIYGLSGRIYYIEETHEEWYYEEKLKNLTEREKNEMAFVLQLPRRFSEQELFYAMLEAGAKLLRVQKYRIYTVDELLAEVQAKYEALENQAYLPRFIHVLMEIRKDYEMDLKGRSFLKLKDFTPEEILYLVDLAQELKEKRKQGIKGDSLKGKNIALIFEKPSTRTRCAFTIGAQDEGGTATYLAGSELQLGEKESIEDTARVLGRMFDGIEFRGFDHEFVEALAAYSGVPVWNGLTDQWHPTQVLATFLTLKENFGYLKGLKLVYLGDGRNNVANSLLVGCTKVGVNIAVAAPKRLWPDEELVKECEEYAKAAGSTIEVTDKLDVVEGADILYTDVWFSMGEEKKEQERTKLALPYQVNTELMKKTGKDTTIFSHCLPANKGKEVTEEVFESEKSKVFDEAENRLHTIKAIMVATLGNR